MRYFRDRHVITQPHVARIEGGGVAEFGRGFGEFAVLDVVPGKDAVGEGVADGVAGKLVADLRSLLASSGCLFGFGFFVGRGGGGGQVVQVPSVRLRGVRGCGFALRRKERAHRLRAVAWNVMAESSGPTGTGKR